MTPISGLETIELLSKIGIALVTIIGGAILRYLYKINNTSEKTRDDLVAFKQEAREESNNIKNQIERLNDRIKDSFSKSETNSLLAQLETKIITLVYDIVNRHKQANKKEGV